MGGKSKTDESINEMVERLMIDGSNASNNSNHVDPGFNTDAKWRDVLELSKGLEQSNERLSSYLSVLKTITIDSTDQKSKLKEVIDDMVRCNKATIDGVSNTVKQMNLISGDIVLEEHALNYLSAINRIDNAVCLSTKTETSISISIEKIKKGE